MSLITSKLTIYLNISLLISILFQLIFRLLRCGKLEFVIAGVTNYGPSYDVGCSPYGGILDRDFWVFEIMMDDTTSVITPPTSAGEIRVYPNPAKDYLVFDIAGAAPPAPPKWGEPARVIIKDVFGRQVAEKQITSEQTVLDVTLLPDGVYFYRIYPVPSGMALYEVTYSGKIVILK